MKRILSLMLLLSFVGTSNILSRGKSAPFFEVFVTSTTEAIPYRIPAIATASDGTLIAVADYRYSRADIGSGRIDLHLRRARKNGRQWQDIFSPSVMQGDGDTSLGHQQAGFDDPCIVADRESRRIMIVSCSGSPGFFSGTRNQHLGWARWYSEDNGKTWSEPNFIDEEYVYRRFDHSAYGPIKGWFVSSGRILQSRKLQVKRYYRLYCAGLSYNGKETANWVLYSDDFGETWSFLGGCDNSPIPGGDEAKVEELPDGNLLISSRCKGGRRFNIFSFTDAENGFGRWSQPAFSGEENHGVSALDNACNGEIMIVPVVCRADKQSMHLLLQSVPFGPGRSNVGIYYKVLRTRDDYDTPQHVANNWTGSYQISQKGSAYSTMTWQKNHTLGFFYEEETHCGTQGGGYTLVYRNVSIEELTEGRFLYRKER